MLYSLGLATIDMNVREVTPMATLRKADLVGSVSLKLGSTKARANSALTAVLDSVQEALATGNKVVLTGFGTFEVRQVKQRRVQPIHGGSSTVVIPAPCAAGSC